MRLTILLACLLMLLAAGGCYGLSLRRDGRVAMETLGRSNRGKENRSPRGHGEGQLRDARHKEKFIKHLTGPLYFNPKCRKHFNRLYYSTRECTTPDYFKRCALMLRRLANSPRCIER